MTDSQSTNDVVVVTGIGGMGQAIARRLGSGRTLVLADVTERRVETVAESLRTDGYVVQTVRTDVSSSQDLAALARTADDLGSIRSIVHTAGVSPVQATAEQIVAVDLIGTVRLLDEFEPYVRHGTVAVCIASMAGTMTRLDPETLHLLATTPADELEALAVLDPSRMDPGTAYSVAKRAVQVRVETAALVWGRRGGRVVSISPGIIATPQGNEELAGPSGDTMRQMIDMSALGRLGTPEDIAAAVEFLVSPNASLITGTDVLVDGGIVAAIHQLQP